MSQASEVKAAMWIGLGYEKAEPGTLGRSAYPHSMFVHVVTWWNPGNRWRDDAAQWLCGNGSHQAVKVTEIPEHMQMCRACEKRVPL